MIPLRDDIRSRGLPIVNYSILGINLLVFIYQYLFTDPHRFILTHGTIPYEISHAVDLPPFTTYPIHLNLIFAMFIHGGLLHIGGNMLFLWVFGDNVEDALGKIRYFLFYLLCGLAGGLLHILIGINSKIPAVGASGAISGILGGYVILFPRARILALVPLFYFIRIMYLPAFAFIGIWFFYQLLYAASSHGGGVAWFAHIGGFLAGVFLVLIFRKGRRRSWDWF